MDIIGLQLCVWDIPKVPKVFPGGHFCHRVYFRLIDAGILPYALRFHVRVAYARWYVCPGGQSSDFGLR